MRPIEFRGMRADTGEFVYGYLVVTPDGVYRIYLKPFDGASSNTWYEVLPETVGQFTGLLDRNGKKIFEGDWIYSAPGYSSFVDFKDGMFISVYNHPEDGEELPLTELFYAKTKPEIIGTIHDTRQLNPQHDGR